MAGFPEMTHYWRNGVRVSRGVDPSVEGYDPDAYLRLYELQRDLGEARGTRRKEASERILIMSNGDPAGEYYGPIGEDERKRFEQRCRELGVEVMDATEENIAYGPGVGQYPPQIRIPKTASYLAHVRELDHAEMDAKNGSPGIAYYLDHPEARAEMEEHAYGLEIERAESDGYTDLAMRLRELLDEEVSRIERESQGYRRD